MRIKEILIWLFIFIVGSLIVTFLVSPNSFNNFKYNLKSILPSNQEVINHNNPKYQDNGGIISSINVNEINNTSNHSSVLAIQVNKEDSLSTKCMGEYRECMEIIEKKNGWTSSLNKAEKFEDIGSAKEFCKSWSEVSLSFTCQNLKDSDLPIVLIAYSLNINNGYAQTKTPFVYGCSEDDGFSFESKIFC